MISSISGNLDSWKLWVSKMPIYPELKEPYCCHCLWVNRRDTAVSMFFPAPQEWELNFFRSCPLPRPQGPQGVNAVKNLAAVIWTNINDKNLGNHPRDRHIRDVTTVLWDSPSYPPISSTFGKILERAMAVDSWDIRRTEEEVFSSMQCVIVASCIKFRIPILLVNPC